MPKPSNPFSTQVGGSHYTQYKIQPYEFFFTNNIPHHKAAIIRRILRYDHPTGKGLEDLNKIQHEVDLIKSLWNPHIEETSIIDISEEKQSETRNIENSMDIPEPRREDEFSFNIPQAPFGRGPKMSGREIEELAEKAKNFKPEPEAKASST